MKSVGIRSMGVAVPKKILSNKDLEKMVDTSDEWIVTRTGISERRVLESHETINDLLVQAALTACEKANINPGQLDFIINSTLSPDRISPAQAFEIGREIKAEKIFGFDINVACSGFVYGLAIAESLLKVRDVSYGLVTAGEQVTRMVDYTDRANCILFGDGATATVVTNDQPDHLIVATEMGSDPSLSNEVVIGGINHLLNNKSEYYFKQNGRSVFKFAVNKIKEMFEVVPRKAGIDPAKIRYVVPHQANIRIIEAAAKEITAKGTEFIVNVNKYGNTSSASIGLALNEAWDRFEKGDLVLLVGFGAGLSWGATLIEW